VLIPGEAEDLWHCYNLISVGDHITSSTIRRVQKETATGSVDSERKKVTLTIAVTGIDFDVVEGGHLRLAGRTSQENRFVKLGSHHTLGTMSLLRFPFPLRVFIILFFFHPQISKCTTHSHYGNLCGMLLRCSDWRNPAPNVPVPLPRLLSWPKVSPIFAFSLIQ
jgi:hypothetical protein